MSMQNDLLEEINKAENDNDLSKCIELCRSALLKYDQLDIEKLFKIKIKLALVLKESSDESGEDAEESIKILNSLMLDISQAEEPEKKAKLNLAFGYAYDQRVKGDRNENLKKAIDYYEQALVFFEKEKYPESWAMIKAGIGQAFAGTKYGNEITNISNAIENYLDTLLIYTKDKYPEDRDDSLTEIILLKKRLNNDKIWRMLIDKKSKSDQAFPYEH